MFKILVIGLALTSAEVAVGYCVTKGAYELYKIVRGK